MAKSKEDGGLSITTMTVLVGAVLAYLLWGIAASMYDVDQGYRWVVESGGSVPRRANSGTLAVMVVGGLYAFISNSIRYLPAMPAVIGFILTKRIWFAVVVLSLGAAVVGFGVVMSRVQQTLEQGGGYRKSRKKRPAAIRTPKLDD